MTTTSPTAGPAEDGAAGLRHELYPYQGESAFLDGAMSFIEDSLAGGEKVLISVGRDKQRILRSELAASAKTERVSFVDAASLGRNPGRLIAGWHDWIARSLSEGSPVRGISESSWDGRTAGERNELQYHDWLLNLAFARSPAWWLLCPYDTTSLEPDVLEAARRCHPLEFAGGAHAANPHYSDEPFRHAELSPPCDPDEEFAYGPGELARVRDKVSACAVRHCLEGERLRELLVAATEVAANSVKHGGGRGTLRTWTEGDDLICEFHDAGHIKDPLLGRVRPSARQIGGRGIWLTQQLCDLVQIRSTAQHGTTVRLHTRLERRQDR